jgi:hypothetical protein
VLAPLAAEHFTHLTQREGIALDRIRTAMRELVRRVTAP